MNKGAPCGMGSAGIMQHYLPACLQQPLLRTGPRGSGEFNEIFRDEAFGIAARWLADMRASVCGGRPFLKVAIRSFLILIIALNDAY